MEMSLFDLYDRPLTTDQMIEVCVQTALWSITGFYLILVATAFTAEPEPIRVVIEMDPASARSLAGIIADVQAADFAAAA